MKDAQQGATPGINDRMIDQLDSLTVNMANQFLDSQVECAQAAVGAFIQYRDQSTHITRLEQQVLLLVMIADMDI